MITDKLSIANNRESNNILNKAMSTQMEVKPVINNSTVNETTRDFDRLVRQSNNIQKIPRSKQKYDALIKVIDESSKSLILHLNNLRDSDTVKRLVEATKRGVNVRVCLTPHNSSINAYELRNIQRLENMGIDIVVRKPNVSMKEVGLVDGLALKGKPGYPTKTTQSRVLIVRAEKAFDQAFSTNTVSFRQGLLEPRKLLFHAMPESTAAPIFNAINSAQKSIDLEIYQITEPTVISSLIHASARGVKVRIMLEPETVGGGNFANIVKKFEAAGIEIKTTPPKFSKGRKVDHAKFLISDGKQVMIGTGNLMRSGLGGHDLANVNNRDFWIESSQKGHLRDTKKLFEADWKRDPTKSSDFRTLVVTPENSEERIFSLINAANERLLVYNQSLNDQETIDCLIAAAKDRNVTIQVLLGFQPGRLGIPSNEKAKKALEEHNIQVKYLRTHYLHAKGIVSDDDAFIGSQNFTNGGMENNREVGLIIKSNRVADTIAELFAHDFVNPSKVTVSNDDNS